MSYKPSEHDGKKMDGTDDKRTNPEHGFGGDSSRASEAGKKGGSQSQSTGESANNGEGVYKPSEHDGLTKSGEPDKRMNSEHGFGGDHERAVEAGKKGGSKSGTEGQQEDSEYVEE